MKRAARIDHGEAVAQTEVHGGAITVPQRSSGARPTWH
jgi:hypothetical protein